MPVGVGEHGLDLRPLDVQLLGDQHRNRGRAALPHFRVRHADRDRSVLVDREPGVDLGAARGVVDGVPGPMFAASATGIWKPSMIGFHLGRITDAFT